MHRLASERQLEVLRQLGGVTDPELDESLIDLGFIENVAVADDGIVTIQFKLPTYWCSPNFAFLMADDMRRAVTALPWVRRIKLELQDHMSSEEINRAVDEGLSFDEAFPELETTGSIDALREKFQRKAFERRQESVLLTLRAQGYRAETLCAMTLADLEQTDLSATEAALQKSRYRDILIERDLARRAEDFAFVRFDGQPIEIAEFFIYLRQLRSVRINMEFNSALCRGLLDARYSSGTPGGCGNGCGDGCAKSGAKPSAASSPA